MSIVMKGIIRKPFMMRLWERYPKSLKYILNIGVFVKYKTLNLNKLPNKIKLPSTNILYINPGENRGRALLIHDGVTQTRLTKFWLKAVKSFKPSLVLDIGVNYGECLFLTTYQSSARIYGIEANHNLIPYLEKSRQDHQNRNQIEIIHAFASDQEYEKKSFYVDTNWSGTSSGIQISAHKMVEKHEVKTITVDSIFKSEHLSQETLLFKIDVEGYEAFVLKGMENLITESKAVLGMIEFDSHYIPKSGVSIEDFLRFLQTYFKVFIFDHDDSLIQINDLTFDQLKSALKTSHIHTDLLLTTSEDFVNALDFIMR